MLVFAAVMLAGRGALASPELDAAREAYLKGSFKLALLRLAEAERSPKTTEDDVVRILWYRGACFHAQGRTADAGKAFDGLLRLRPLYEPDRLEAPPDLRAVFDARARAWQEQHGVTFGDPSVEGRTIALQLSGNVAAAPVVMLFVRAAGEVQFRELPMGVQGTRAAVSLDEKQLWEEAGRAGAFELVLEGRSARGVPISRRGDAVQPVRLPVTPDVVQAARAALTPPPPAVTAPPPEPVKPARPPESVQPAPSTEKEPSRLPLVAGGGLLAAGGVLLGLAVLTGLLDGASWLTFAATRQFIVENHRQALTVQPLYNASFVAGYTLPIAAVGLLVVALALLGAGGVVLLVRMLV